MTKLAKDFYGVPTGEIFPRTIKAGEECPANLENAAGKAGALDIPEKKKPVAK